MNEVGINLEKIGIDLSIYNHINRIAKGGVDSFTNEQIKKINDTLDYRKGSKGDLTLLVDSTRKTYESINKKSKNVDDSLVQKAIEKEKNKAKKTLENYRNLKKDLRKLLNKKGDKQETAKRIINIIKENGHKSKPTSNIEKIMQKYKNESDKYMVLNFYSGNLTLNEIEEILKILGYDMDWYSNQILDSISRGYSSSQAVEEVAMIISDKVTDYLNYTRSINGLTFKHDDGSNYTIDEKIKSLENCGIEPVILKYLHFTDDTLKNIESVNNANGTFTMWEDYDKNFN